MCYDADVPTTETIQQAYIPLRDGRGPVPPNNIFKDAVLDIRQLELPLKLILSCGRDGTIKMWR
jgi:hypothetical protein